MIRKAKLADLDNIWLLRLKTSQLLHERGVNQWQSIFPLKEQFMDDIHKQEFYVLEMNQHIIGMMALKAGNEPTYDIIYDGAWHKQNPYLTIHRIAIDPMYHGYQYGLELLSFAKEQATLLGYHYMRIDTHEDNQAAIKRFTQFGFVYCGYILLSSNHSSSRKRLAYDLIWE